MQRRIFFITLKQKCESTFSEEVDENRPALAAIADVKIRHEVGGTVRTLSTRRGIALMPCGGRAQLINGDGRVIFA